MFTCVRVGIERVRERERDILCCMRSVEKGWLFSPLKMPLLALTCSTHKIPLLLSEIMRERKRERFVW
jgi:hypothetical protein